MKRLFAIFVGLLFCGIGVLNIHQEPVSATETDTFDITVTAGVVSMSMNRSAWALGTGYTFNSTSWTNETCPSWLQVNNTGNIQEDFNIKLAVSVGTLTPVDDGPNALDEFELSYSDDLWVGTDEAFLTDYESISGDGQNVASSANFKLDFKFELAWTDDQTQQTITVTVQAVAG